MASVCTFARLPDEEPEFLRYLQRTGDIWARASNDDPEIPNWQPMPVADFLERFATEIQAYSVVGIYIGFKADVLQPQIYEHECTEGGTLEPVMQDGKVLPGVQKIVGGKNVLRRAVDSMASHLVAYRRGEFREPRELAISNLSFYSGTYHNDKYVNKPEEFMNWANKATPGSPFASCCVSSMEGFGGTLRQFGNRRPRETARQLGEKLAKGRQEADEADRPSGHPAEGVLGRAGDGGDQVGRAVPAEQPCRVLPGNGAGPVEPRHGAPNLTNHNGSL